MPRVPRPQAQQQQPAPQAQQQPAPQMAPPQGQRPTFIRELAELAALRREGLLSEAEFDLAKRRLLAQ